MISSMTAFSNTRLQSDEITINVEIKSVNSRYLDLNLKIPDQLSSLEVILRQLLTEEIMRGKIEIRIQFQIASRFSEDLFTEEALDLVKQRFEFVKEFFPGAPEPGLSEILSHIKYENRNRKVDRETLQARVLEATKTALDEFEAMRVREGRRLATAMREFNSQIKSHVQTVQAELPRIQKEQQTRIAQRLTQSIQEAVPEGFSKISGEELSARIAAEGSLFSLKTDVAEELTRLQSHCEELELILNVPGNNDSEPAKREKPKQSTGKRMDFIFQEMNREINTLGSKSSSMNITNAVIEMKLLVEQLREQALNIE